MTTKSFNIFTPFYWGSYLKNTRHLNTEEHGAYLLLLAEYYVKGEALPDQDDQLARIVGLTKGRWQKSVRPVVAKFFRIKDGQWIHDRCELEIARAISNRGARRKGAEKTNAQRWAKPAPEQPADASLSDGSATPERPDERPGSESVNGRYSHTHTHTHTHSEPQTGGERENSAGAGEAGSRVGQVPPMDREAFLAGAALRGIGAECAVYWWNEWDAVNWDDGKGRVIAQPLALLQNRWTSWQAKAGQQRLRERSEDGHSIAGQKKPAPLTPEERAAAKRDFERRFKTD